MSEHVCLLLALRVGYPTLACSLVVNPNALRFSKTPLSFGLLEYNRIKVGGFVWLLWFSSPSSITECHYLEVEWVKISNVISKPLMVARLPVVWPIYFVAAFTIQKMACHTMTLRETNSVP